MAKRKNYSLLQRVEAALNTIRPYLEADGGNVEIVEVTNEHVLKLRLVGSCETCPMSYMTMQAGIEDAIKKSVPEIKRVETINIPTQR